MNDAKGNPIECPWCKAIPERTDLAPSQRYRITHESLCFLIGRLTDPWGRDGRSHFIPLQEIDAWNAAARVSDSVAPTVDDAAVNEPTPRSAVAEYNATVAPVEQSEADPRCEICETALVLTLDQRTTWQQYACPESGKGNKLGHTIIPVGYKQSPATPAPSAATQDETLPTFRTTKEAMLYAQQLNIPAVIPVTSPSTHARAAAEEIAAWIFKLEQPLTSELDLSTAQGVVEKIIERHCSPITASMTTPTTEEGAG